MLQVNNGKLMKYLTMQNLKAHKVRNRIAVLAIILTTLLFTSIFAILASLNVSFQQETFRQVGGYFHAGIKQVSEEQAKEFAADPMVKRAGMRYFLGMAEDVPFNKCHVEISYMDAENADSAFCVPEQGTLPAEGTKEVATDTRILQLLDITPQIGVEVPFTYTLGDGSERTDTFVLCGWWEYDPASSASMVIVSKSYCEEVLTGYSITEDDATGTWNLEVMFDDSFDIEGKMAKLLAGHGYQMEDPAAENYLNVGVNWAYTSTQLLQNISAEVVVGVAAFLLLVIFTGYLIIYNIFRISVTDDIRFYGLLKTIGMTEKQIQKMIRMQSGRLSLIGIPIGLVLGFLLGNTLVPMIMKNMSYQNASISFQPLLFVAAALFSFVTVRISCRKPAKIAANVSPVEAVRYTEAVVGNGRKHQKGDKQSAQTTVYTGGQEQAGQKYASIVLPAGSSGQNRHMLHMAFANVGRSWNKTILVVLSLVLSALLFNLTLAFANGFDLDKYTSSSRTADYLVANADYFQYKALFSEEISVTEDVIRELNEQPGITDTGRVYGMADEPVGWFTQTALDAYYQSKGYEEYDEAGMEREQNAEGLYEDRIQLYGMEEFPLTQLTVLEGDVEQVKNPSGNYIIQVLSADDYGNPIEGSGAYQVGDTITITYGQQTILYDSRTGEEVDRNRMAEGEIPEQYIEMKPGEKWDVTYTVCAQVIIPTSMSYRYYGSMEYILGADAFIRDTKTSDVMLYMMNVADEQEAGMDAFLETYTTKTNPLYNYESKKSYQDEFESFRSMFLIVGSALAFIVGLVGILNFFNAILTGIQTRRREFAVMQSVGMTGVQLKRMLILEGVLYTGMSIAAAIVCNLVFEPFLLSILQSVLWFFTGRVTILPLILLIPVYILIGVLVPVVLYRSIERSSVVERLRVVE
ncbi:MAG: ABC transporter permease [Lachnospiraceae bacterium]|nr:ABC transporter permease [Lachnospiraceae bacterium]